MYSWGWGQVPGGGVGPWGSSSHVEEFKVSLGPAGEVAEHPVVPPLLGLGEDLLPPDQGGGGLRPLHEAGVGDLEAVGDFPEGVDGGLAFPFSVQRAWPC